MNSKDTMDIESQYQPNEGDLIVQGEFVSYRDAYELNGAPIVETQILIEIIALILGAVLEKTDQIPDTLSTPFNGKSVPAISIKDYLARIMKRAECSDECLMLALIYIDRMTERNNKLVIKSINIHRFLITAVMLAAKFYDDRYYNNEYYSRVGGISKKEINQLEVEFLNYINFNLYVEPELFFKYRDKILSQVKIC